MQNRKLKDRSVVPAWECRIVNGKVIIRDREDFDKYVLPFEGKENMQLILKKKVKSRSRKEEKYYHAVPVKFVAEEMNITREEAHEFLKNMFLKSEERIVTDDGKVIRYERTLSTTELGDQAYREYWNKVVQWAALPTEDGGLSPTSGLGLFIPMPNEAEWDGRDEYDGDN